MKPVNKSISTNKKANENDQERRAKKLVRLPGKGGTPIFDSSPNSPKPGFLSDADSGSRDSLVFFSSTSGCPIAFPPNAGSMTAALDARVDVTR